MASKRAIKKNKTGSDICCLSEQVYCCRGAKAIERFGLKHHSELHLPSDVSLDMRGLELGQIRLSLGQRYNKLTRVVFEVEDCDLPVSYCYYELGDLKPEAKYNGVKMLQFLHFDTEKFRDCDKAWLNLNKEGKANLHRILLTAYNLWHLIIYKEEEKKWITRDHKFNEESFPILLTYGASTDSPDVMSYLRQGLSTKEMGLNIDRYLLNAWLDALSIGMTNGVGQTAVYELLRRLIDLLPHANVNTDVSIVSVTSPENGDDLTTPDSSSLSLWSPPSKRKKKVADAEAYKMKDDETGDRGAFSPTHKQFVDLKVICRDEKTGLPKHVMIVAIHTIGKNRIQAANEFLKEIIGALQAQNAVTGLLFSYDRATLYLAERTVTSEIVVNRLQYFFVHVPETTSSLFLNVAALQTMIMDIFTCLIYGIKNIEP